MSTTEPSTNNAVPQFDPAQFAVKAAAGRDCGTCTLCCKVYDVPSLNKPAGKWCTHCTPGKGCGIHETRPTHCRSFFCLYMTETWLGDEWKPEIAKFVLTIEPMNGFMVAQLDPGQPTAWKREPYYSQLKRWSESLLNEKKHLIVFNNRHATLVMPDRDTVLGVLGPEDRFRVVRVGIDYAVEIFR